MAGGNVLAEFLVSLGWDIKESEHKKFQYALKATSEGVETLGKGIAAVSLALAAGMERIADQFSRLYYTSQLTGVTVANLRALTFAANQVGVSGDTMVESVRQMHVLLQQPGGEAMIRAFTGFKGQITSSDQALNILLGHWHDMFQHGQQFMVRLEAQVLHLNEAALEPMILNWGVASNAVADYARRAQNLGIDKAAQDRMAQQGRDFMRQWSTFISEIELFYDKAYSDFIGPFTGGLKSINTELDVLGGKFAHMDLGTRRFIEAGVAITGVVGALKALKATASFLGIGGAAKAAARGAAGEAGAAAPAAAGGASFWGALMPFLAGAELGNLATSGPGSKEWAQGVNKQHEEFWENLRKRFGGLFHQQSYQVPGGGGMNPLLHLASYEAPTQGGGYGAAGDLQSWLHGSTSFIPSVRIIDATGIFGGGAGGGGAGFGGVGGVGGNFAAPSPGRSDGTPKPWTMPYGAGAGGGNIGWDAAEKMIEHFESGGRNVMNYINDASHTAGGYFQITNSTWRRYADAVKGASQYQSAISAPFKTQEAVAKAIYEHEGFAPWANYDRRLAAAINNTRLGVGDVHHHHGNRTVVAHQGDVNVTVHGSAGDAVGPMRSAHSRVLGDAVRNLSTVIA